MVQVGSHWHVIKSVEKVGNLKGVFVLSTVLVPRITGDSVELCQELLDSLGPPNGTDFALSNVSSDKVPQRCDPI